MKLKNCVSHYHAWLSAVFFPDSDESVHEQSARDDNTPMMIPRLSAVSYMILTPYPTAAPLCSYYTCMSCVGQFMSVIYSHRVYVSHRSLSLVSSLDRSRSSTQIASGIKHCLVYDVPSELLVSRYICGPRQCAGFRTRLSENLYSVLEAPPSRFRFRGRR